MYIKQITVKNYKSFLAPQNIQFVPGINIIIGPNNSGKTALAEVLTLKFTDKPHRSIKTIPEKGGAAPGVSAAQIDFSISSQELKQIFWENARRFLVKRNDPQDKEKEVQAVIDIFSLSEILVTSQYQSQSFVSADIAGLKIIGQATKAYRFDIKDRDVLPDLSHTNVPFDLNNSMQMIAAKNLATKIYHFKAERFNVGQYQIGNNPNLEPDASNLAQVLNFLQTSNPARFRRLVELIKIVFPDIKDITVPPLGNSANVRIQLWHVDPSTERSDLASSLQESGTGIGQVLAILYVAINSDYPRPVVIDEPQSFLHPMAIRKLFDILNHEFPQHQYIITTHSPLVISAARPNRIISLQKEENETKAKLIDATQTDELRTILTDVGARLSDVFGTENILWVEGATEENCFPLIITKLLKRPLLGTSILGILNVGDLEGKHKSTVLRIYKKLSEGHALIPPAIGFILDQEGRTDSEQQDIERESGDKAYFIKRRMYENYLIHADAIVWLISQLENFSDTAVEQKEVEKWIEDNRWGTNYFSDPKSLPDKTPETWLQNVHGAKFLDDLFKSLSDGRYYYDKVQYGLELTSWLINNRPDELKEVADLLGQILTTE